MRLPDEAHTTQPWRIHEIAPDFRLEDVWQIRGTGSPEDFGRLVDGMTSSDPSESQSFLVRALFDLRWKIGGLLGWDEEETGVDSRVGSLRERLPVDLLDSPGPDFESLPFRSLYLTDDEFAAEVANETVHGVMHIGRVREPAGAYREQMAVLVKPNGLLGRGYMAAITPFRHLIVYPAMLRQIEGRLQEAARA
jgi:hypothetical protein